MIIASRVDLLVDLVDAKVLNGLTGRLFHCSLNQIIYNGTLTEILDGTNNRRYQKFANNLPVSSKNTQRLAQYPRNLLMVGPEAWQN
jgi:hypothetical protein